MHSVPTSQEAQDLERQQLAWSEFWHCRQLLWAYAKRRQWRHPFWYEHSPRAWRYYRHIKLEAYDLVEQWYVRVGLALDHLLSGEQEALAELRRLLSFQRDQGVRRLRQACQRYSPELLFQPRSNRARWVDEYRYWLSTVEANIKRLQPWYSWNLAHYIDQSRRRVRAYDAMAAKRYGWWHKLVVWMQGISRRRRIVALADVQVSLKQYLNAATDKLPDRRLNSALTHLRRIDPTTTGLTESIEYVITQHRIETELTEPIESKENDMSMREHIENIPEALTQEVWAIKRSIMSHLDQLVLSAVQGDMDAIALSWRQLYEAQSSSWARLVEAYPQYQVSCIQLKCMALQTLSEIETQLFRLSNYCSLVQSQQSELSALENLASLSSMLERYRWASDQFKKSHEQHQQFIAVLLPEDCDHEIWNLFKPLVDVRYQEYWAAFTETLIAYEDALAEQFKQAFAEGPSLEKLWQQIENLLEQNSASLYQQKWRRSQENAFETSLYNELVQLSSTAHGHSLKLLEKQRQEQHGHIAIGLNVIWELLDEIRVWRESLADWSRRYATTLAQLKQFRFRRASPTQLTKLWDDYRALITTFRAIDHLIQLSYRCDVARLFDDQVLDKGLPIEIYEEQKIVKPDPTSPHYRGAFCGYYNSEILMTYETRNLFPSRGVIFESSVGVNNLNMTVFICVKAVLNYKSSLCIRFSKSVG